MPIIGERYILDLDHLPSKSERLQVRFGRQLVNNHKETLLLYPNSAPGSEPTYIRYMCGMDLRLADGTSIGRIGQLIVTPRRLLGMVTNGSEGQNRLDDETGSIYVFAVEIDKIQEPKIKNNWRGKPVTATLRPELFHEQSFALGVYSVAANVKNDGKVNLTNLFHFLKALSEYSGNKGYQSPAP